MRAWLVAAEIALTVVLLCGAGLLIKSAWRLTAYPAGFAPDRTLTATVQFLAEASQDDERRRLHLDEALQRLSSLAGVEAVGLSTNGGGRMRLFIEGAPSTAAADRPTVTESAVSSGYARAIGMRVVAGRWFAEAEPHPVFVINESLARRHFTGVDSVGKRIQVGGRPGAADGTFATIIGVVADLRYSKLDVTPEPEIFADYTHAVPIQANFVVRTSSDQLVMTSAMRKELVDIDPSLAVSEINTLEQALAESIAPRRFNLFLFGTFAGSALLLAAIGIYGVIAYSVAQRRQEIGVRIALGAEPWNVLRMVVQQGMSVAAAGLMLGMLAALAATRAIATLLYEVNPTDPATFVTVAVVLTITALAACCGPALKATRVDPLVALRYE
jgi:putative ABC transport system permease protein